MKKIQFEIDEKVLEFIRDCDWDLSIDSDYKIRVTDCDAEHVHTSEQPLILGWKEFKKSLIEYVKDCGDFLDLDEDALDTLVEEGILKGSWPDYSLGDLNVS